jgi:hypothetical protein
VVHHAVVVVPEQAEHEHVHAQHKEDDRCSPEGVLRWLTRSVEGAVQNQLRAGLKELLSRTEDFRMGL